MISVTIDSPSDSDIGPQWDDLVLRASSNVFMNPAALRAASETKFADLRRLLAWEEGADGRKLVGVWALQLRKVAPFWPAVLEALPYDYAFVSSPVIDPLHVDEVVPALFAAIETSGLPTILSLQSLDAKIHPYPALVNSFAASCIEPLMLSYTASPSVTR